MRSICLWVALRIALAVGQKQSPVARLPPMGWRSWNLFESNVSQELLLKQVDGLTRVRHGVSLLELGYNTIGLDDGWQDCQPNGYHDEKTGVPLVNRKFPDMLEMTNYAHSKNVSMGWYGNNRGCHGKLDVDRYEQDAIATVRFGFDGIKVDSCGPETNISAWRSALDAASAKYGNGRRIILENCRVYSFTQELSKTSACEFELFRSTEDNAPDFASIMHNLMINAKVPGSGGNVHGGLPVSHQGCWSYPDMLETTGSGKCRQDLKPGTCGHASVVRREGGLNLNESQAHFGAWCVVSSPLTLGHDLANDTQYDAAWPIISNREALRVNQIWAGDAGRLVASSSEIIEDMELYHGAGCECVYSGSLPTWAVFAKRLETMPSSEVAVIAINMGNSILAAGSISISLESLFGSEARSTELHITERNVWAQTSGRTFLERSNWTSLDLSPRSSFFVTLSKKMLNEQAVLRV